MTYDSDKTPQILKQLRESVDAGDFKSAIQLLRHADAGGRMRADQNVLNSLRAAVGERQTSGIIQALATDTCRYCTDGRERCRECRGKGYVLDTKVCRECAGLGVLRCPFCNGTAFAGYDFVPRGLRSAVIAYRLKIAEQQLSELIPRLPSGRTNSAELVRRMLDIDRSRGILANAMEQVQLHDQTAPGARGMISSSVRAAVERQCIQANARAEAAIRKLLFFLAELYAARAQRSEQGAHRVLDAHRAKTFARLSRADRFDNSVLQTPQSLRHGD